MLDEESGRKRWFLVIENVTDGRLRQKSGMINFMFYEQNCSNVFEICLSRLECMHTVNENQGCLPCENVGASTNIIYLAFLFCNIFAYKRRTINVLLKDQVVFVTRIFCVLFNVLNLYFILLLIRFLLIVLRALKLFFVQPSRLILLFIFLIDVCG